MLSKQQKQRYGEILRQQMKEKEQKKRSQDNEKRGNMRQVQPSREQPVYHSPQIYEKQNTYTRPYVDPKQQLQKKLESQQYNPFGGSGGGAPNRMVQQNVTNARNMSQPTNVRMGAEQMMSYNDMNNYQNPYNNPPQQRTRTLNEDNSYYQGQVQPNQMQSISPQSINYPPRQPEQQRYQDGGNSSVPQRMPNPYQQQPIQNYPGYNNNSYNNYPREDSRQPNSFELLPENTKQGNSRLQEYQQNNGTMQQSYQPTNNQGQSISQQRPMQPTSFVPTSMEQAYQPYDEQIENTNQELQDVYKKGGRNLLKLQNQTIDQQLIKQKRKLQIQKQLKQQIQQGERRKKEEKQRLKREQQEDERKHMAYLNEQKRKIQDEERKKRDQKQKMIDDNIRNLEQKKMMEGQAKRNAQRQRMDKQKKSNDYQKQKDDQLRQQQQNERKKTMTKPQPQQNFFNEQSRGVGKSSGRITDDDATSVVSSDTSQMQKGFNAALSKQFFRNQRQKNNPSGYKDKKIEQFSNQIQQISNELVQQRNLMAREMDMVRNEVERAKSDKKQADDQIQRLKKQLNKKMNDDNDKLLRALQGNDFRNNDYSQLPSGHYKNLNNYQVPMQQHNMQNISQNQYPSFGKKPLRQRQQQHLVQKQFEVEAPQFIYHRQEQLNQFEQSNVGMISLAGDSKKIPLFLQNSDKLTMSQVQNFAKDSAFFQKVGVNRVSQNSPPKQKYNINIKESIAQQPQEDRDLANNYSRKSNRHNKQGKKQSSLFKQKDELDNLMESRAKSRGGWGEMSSVNSDINKEIQELLKAKGNSSGNNNGRPSSISNAGRQSLSNQGYAYDGLSLNSQVGGVGTLNTNGTVDLERINGRNDARLREFKNLGVETINTNGDDELNNLDRLLYKYN